MTKFTFDDTVKVAGFAPHQYRPGRVASIVGVYSEEEREHKFLEQYPHGVVYMIEFEGGEAVCVPERFLESGAFPSEAVAKR